MATEPPGGRIDVLGPLRVSIDGRPSRPPQGRARLLLEALVTAPDHRLPATHLAQALWPGVDDRVGRARLQTTASRLRRELPTGTQLTFSRGSYHLAAATDLDEFRRLAEAAARHDDSAARQRALALWRGEPYEGFAATASVRLARSRAKWLHEALVSRTPAAPSVEGIAQPPTRGPFDDSTTGVDVRRPRLHDALPDVGRARLVVLAAPSGYGKTTLLRHWSAAGTVAWVAASAALDGDADLRGAIDVALRAAGIVATSSDGGVPSVNELTNAMLAEPSPTALVIDGLEKLQNAATHRVVHDVIRLAPDHVTIAIASRRRIPAPISRFAASADAALLSVDQLAFTLEEAHLAIEQVAGRDALTQLPVRAIHRATAGWPAPLMRIAGELVDPRRQPQIQPEPEPDAIDPDLDARLLGTLPEGFHGEILEDLTHEDRAWLVATAHLDALHDDLCETVTERPTLPVVTRLVIDHHLLDRAGDTFRPRPPLQHLLRRRQMRDTTLARELHRRSARWHLIHGPAAEALDRSLASGDPALRRQALEPAVRHAIDAGNVDALRRWAEVVGTERATADDELTLLAGALLPRSIRTRLLSVDDAARAGAGASAIEAVELWSTGRCQDALGAARQARRLPARGDATAPSATTTVLMAVEVGCRILLGHDLDRDEVSSLLRAADRAHQPWLRLWAHGQLALHAHLAGDVGMARALLTHPRAESQLHESANYSVGGFALAGRSLTQAESGPAPAPSDGVAALRRLAHSAHRAGWKPLEAIANYALHDVLRRGGDGERSAAALAAADHARLQLPDLAFLDAVREWAVAGVAEAGRDAVDLTHRERTVLRYLATDLTLREIADTLFVSLHTVRAHTRSIYRKLGVSSRADALALQPASTGWAS